ncbi:efflux RND transporter periplasmic adaptor subunit [Anaerovorax odorimutans]|uniref:efflux RND transporter periplasmic adaptor subunit n=1 Tax=Anaerovorax odorimutans TaxID=109327 RepID=UPI0003FA32BD|nr:efflux RND transporter periplasmic adaptor subunit [Anaerovorax odorimutans]
MNKQSKENALDGIQPNLQEEVKEEINLKEGTTLKEEETDSKINKQKKSKKKMIIIIVLIILFILLIIFRFVSSRDKETEDVIPPVNVKISTVQLQSLATTTPLSGRIKPIEEVSIIPLTSGHVTKVYVDLGDKVSKGTLLFEIDKTPLIASLNQALDAYQNAQTNFERMSTLYNEGAVSLQEYEQSRSKYISAQSSYTTINDNVNNCTVTSPIDGYVTSIDVSTGSMASQSIACATVANTNQLEIETNVSEYLISKINIGDPVNIYIKSLSEEPYKGNIKEISPAPATGSLTYPINISIDNSSKEIKAGMFAEIEIVSDEKDKVLCVPSDAVIIRSNESQVAVLKKDVPEFKTVVTGLDNGKLVEIKSGLKEGDTIIIQGQNYITPGEPVSIID